MAGDVVDKQREIGTGLPFVALTGICITGIWMLCPASPCLRMSHPVSTSSSRMKNLTAMSKKLSLSTRLSDQRCYICRKPLSHEDKCEGEGKAWEVIPVLESQRPHEPSGRICNYRLSDAVPKLHHREAMKELYHERNSYWSYASIILSISRIVRVPPCKNIAPTKIPPFEESVSDSECKVSGWTKLR